MGYQDYKRLTVVIPKIITAQLTQSERGSQNGSLSPSNLHRHAIGQ